MRLEGKNIILRDMERKDAQQLADICKEPKIARFLPDWSEGKDSAQDYYPLIQEQQALSGDPDLHKPHYYAVTLPGRDELIGMVGVREHPDLNEVALTYFMSEASKGCGYTKEAVNLLSDWCLRRDDLPYLIMAVEDGNASACRLAEKCGFTLCEKRVTISHRLPGMQGDLYYYYRKY